MEHLNLISHHQTNLNLHSIRLRTLQNLISSSISNRPMYFSLKFRKYQGDSLNLLKNQAQTAFLSSILRTKMNPLIINLKNQLWGIKNKAKKKSLAKRKTLNGDKSYNNLKISNLLLSDSKEFIIILFIMSFHRILV